MIFPSIDTVGADIAVPGGDITSTATTFNLLNATVTTLNIGGAATTVSIGAGAAATLNANFTTQINLNTAAIVSSQTTVALLNTTTTTVNAFGAATAISIGAATGTLTLANPSVRFADGSAAAPSITFTSDPNTGFYSGGADNIRMSVGGTIIATVSSTIIELLTSVSIGSSGDVILTRDAANILALRNGVNAQTFNLYATYTDASNYEGGYLTAAAGSVTLGGRTAGTGTDDIYLVLSPAGAGTVVGSTAANGDLTLEGTSHATKTTSYVILQPTGGFVGIGTTVPQSLLDVQGPVGTGAATAGILTLATKELTIVSGDQLGRINFNAPLESDGSDAILVGAAIWAQATATFSATVNTTDLIFAVGVSEAAVEQFRIASDGGLFAQTLLQQSAAGLVVEWDSTGKEIYAETSALRFKDNVQDFYGAARLTELRPKSWTDKVSGRSEVGLIAEEVAATVPELAVYDGDGQPIGVKYHKLSVLLLGRVTRLERALLAAGIAPEMVQ